jgi:hypothetical protein
VRRSNPSKQRLWLGTRQYRDGCRNTATHSSSDSYAANNGYAVRADNANADTVADYSTNTDSDADANAYANWNRSPKSDAHSIGLPWRRLYTIANGNIFTSPDAHATTQSHAKASTESTSSAVRGAVIPEK